MRAFAERLAASLKGGDVIALMGPLGAGKTAFTQFLGRALGVRERITSPTFTLMHVHGTGGRRSAVGGRRIRYLVHIDAYRLAGAKALRAIGALDYLGAPDTVAVVEWAERVRSALPKTARKIRITPRTDGTRVIMMETGKRKSGKRTIGKKNG